MIDSARPLYPSTPVAGRGGDGDFAIAVSDGTGAASAASRSEAEYRSGLAAHAKGESEIARRAFETAVALNPNNADAWLALADAARLAGDEDVAQRAYLSSVTASVGNPHLMAAALALREGQLGQAEPLLRATLRAQPTNVAAIRMMGELAIHLGRLTDAITLLRRACALAPGFAAAREMLARTLQRNGEFIEALSEADHLLDATPDNASVAMLKAALLVRIGDNEAAADLYRAILDRHPRQAKGWMSYGHVLKAIGRTGEAVTAYRNGIDIQPSFGELWWSLANLKTFRFSAVDIDMMRGALQDAPADEDRFHLLFALGKALEDDGDDDAAFDAYSAANDLRRKTVDYCADDTRQRAQATIGLYTPAFIKEREEGGCLAPDPIFIVGLPRSGSTLVEQILASHSMIEGTSELPDLMSIAARFEKNGATAPSLTLSALSPADRKALGAEYIERTKAYRREPKAFFIDKMPNNWENVGLIHLILPNAKIIDVRRHPFASGWSSYKQHFSRGQGFSYDLTDLGSYYADYCGVMRHFDDVMPGKIHRLIYERLVADIEGQTRQLFDHLGLPFEEACLAFWRNQRAVRTPSSEQVRQPIYTSGLDHWKRFSGHLDPMAAALGPWLEQWDQDQQDLKITSQGNRVTTTM